MSSIRLYRFGIPFHSEFITATGRYSHRSGLFLHFRDGPLDVLSEISPLPGFSGETIQQAEEEVIQHADAIHAVASKSESLDDAARRCADLSLSPSVAFGVSCMALGVLSQRLNISIPALFQIRALPAIQKNATISAGTQKEMVNAMEKAVQAGFQTIKCKLTPEYGPLLKVLEKIHQTYPGCTFRLDANRSLPIEETPSVLRSFRHLPVEYVEEPCACSSIGEKKELITASPLPIAFDESITSFASLREHLLMEQQPILVVKPALFGSVFDLTATFRRHHDLSNNRLVFSTLLESIVGIRILDVLAALFGSRMHAQGLATDSLFAKPVVQNQPGINPMESIHQGTGWGVRFGDLRPDARSLIFEHHAD
ncbi:MAG: o-succinylbenzoate synthase [Balneolaceae bacterium]